MRHVIWMATVVVGVQGLALTAHAAPDPNRAFTSAVTACNTVLEPYAGVDLAVSLPSGGPQELSVGVSPFPDLTQYIDAIAADPPGEITGDPPGSLSAIVDPNDKFLFATFNAAADGSSQMDVDVGPGVLQAVFWIPPDWDLTWNPPDWDGNWNPPDWDLQAGGGPAVIVQLDDHAGLTTVNLTNPPEPDRQLRIVVEAGSVGTLSFVDSEGRDLELAYPTATR